MAVESLLYAELLLHGHIHHNESRKRVRRELLWSFAHDAPARCQFGLIKLVPFRVVLRVSETGSYC